MIRGGAFPEEDRLEIGRRRRGQGVVPERRALEAELGYGFGLFADRWTTTPELGFGLTDTGRKVTLGWRLAEQRQTGLAFGFDVEGTRHEDAPGAAGHRLSLSLGWNLKSTGAERFEIQLERSRTEPASNAAKHRVGISLTAAW